METIITHNGIKFVDAQAMRLVHTATFAAPSKKELARIKTGDFVKICVNNERFWVEVKNVSGKIITGRIDNDLLQRQLKYNDILEFPKSCIYEIS